MAISDVRLVIQGHYQSSIPGPSLLKAPSFTRRMIADPLSYLLDMQAAYGDIVRLPFPATLLFLVTDPELIGSILLGTEKTNKKSIAYRRLKPILGEGLITSNGETWKKQRRLSNPAFHKRVVDGLVPMIREETEAMASDWESRLDKNPEIDISQEMMKLSFRIVARALFATDLSEKADVIRDSLHLLQNHANRLFYSVLSVSTFLPTAYNRKVKKALADVDAVIHEMIREHRLGNYEDLVSVYVRTKDEVSGQGMTDQQIRDEIVTLMYAGHDTTAFTLSMLLDNVARHPEVKRKLQEEVQSSEIGAELPYCNWAMMETMRLYPASWTVSRELTEDLSYKNFFFPKGSCFLFPQYLVHRHPRLWKDAAAFQPERFAKALPHPFAYFPFGGGQRSCIGSQMSKLEIQTIIPLLMKRFDFEPIEGEEASIGARITLTFQKPLRMRLKRRKDSTINETSLT